MTLVSTIAASREQAIAAAEDILREIAPLLTFNSGEAANVTDYSVRHLFTEEQLAVFDTLGWDRRTIRREAARVAGVVRLQAQAGTAATREAAKKAAADAAAKLDAEDDEILEQLKQWQAKLDALKAAVRDTAAVVAKQEAAVGHLREAVPLHVKERYNRAYGEIAANYTELRAGAETDELAEIEEQRQADLAAARKILDHYLT